eukprot:1999997-Heterocapsa_arctica.AAC.1
MGNAGAVCGLPYQQAVAEIMEGHGRKPKIADAPKGLLPKADPAGRPAPATPQDPAGGSSGSQVTGPRKEEGAGGPPKSKTAGLTLGP